MIKNKRDLDFYLESDRVSLKRDKKILKDTIWRFEICLRKLEYYHNTGNRLMEIIYKIMYRRLCGKTGFHIPINCCGPGLALVHIGPVIINQKSIVGENCRFQTGVTLGATNGKCDAPCIGDNVFLSEGVKVIGGVRIADDVQLGANAVVVKDILEKGTTWGGVPAKKISNNSSRLNLIKGTEIVRAK